VELLRKLALTSILALIAPGSAGQVVVGLLLAFALLVANLKLKPYAMDALNGVNQMAQINLFFVLLVGAHLVSRCFTLHLRSSPARPRHTAALLLKVNLDGEGDARFFTGIVGALCLLPVCLPVLLRVYARLSGGGLDARAITKDNDWSG
jgi:hypothetical protein